MVQTVQPRPVVHPLGPGALIRREHAGPVPAGRCGQGVHRTRRPTGHADHVVHPGGVLDAERAELRSEQRPAELGARLRPERGQLAGSHRRLAGRGVDAGARRHGGADGPVRHARRVPRLVQPRRHVPQLQPHLLHQRLGRRQPVHQVRPEHAGHDQAAGTRNRPRILLHRGKFLGRQHGSA